MTMIVWPTGKREEIINRIMAHKAADEIVQGTTFDGHQGCAIGCSLDAYSHEGYCRDVLNNNPYNDGMKLANLIDTLHENVTEEYSLSWPLRVAETLTVGIDISLALPRWLLWVYTAELKLDGSFITHLQSRLSGVDVSRREWNEVYRTVSNISVFLATYYPGSFSEHEARNVERMYYVVRSIWYAAVYSLPSSASDVAYALGEYNYFDKSYTGLYQTGRRQDAFARMADALLLAFKNELPVAAGVI